MTTTGTTTMMTTTDRSGPGSGLTRRLVVPSMVTAASIAVLLFTVGGAVEPATSTPPSTAGSAPQSTVAQPTAAGQPRVSGLDTAVQRVLADSGASRVVHRLSYGASPTRSCGAPSRADRPHGGQMTESTKGSIGCGYPAPTGPGRPDHRLGGRCHRCHRRRDGTSRLGRRGRAHARAGCHDGDDLPRTGGAPPQGTDEGAGRSSAIDGAERPTDPEPSRTARNRLPP